MVDYERLELAQRIDRAVDRLRAANFLAGITGIEAIVDELLSIRRELAYSPEPEPLLAPARIAGRLGIGEQQVRRLCRKGLAKGVQGVQKPKGRFRATVSAVNSLRQR